jgi:predicted N-acyltransferase
MKEIKFRGPWTLKIAGSVSEFDPAQWNNLVDEKTVPFLEWEWLAALEESGSAAPETGWHPLHLSLWDKDALLAAAPLYLKNHSDGEFVWDYMWARAAGQLKRAWYPKLVGTVPATPAEGYRFLAAPGEDATALNRTLLDAAEALCRGNGVRGLHFLFADPDWAARPDSLAERGYSAWEHQRYVWENTAPDMSVAGPPPKRPYSSFDDFLSCFNKNQRKNIRKEYRRHEEQDIGLRIVENPGASYFEKIHELYTITNDKFIPWDARWVNADFFHRLATAFSHRVVFSEAFVKNPAPNRNEETAALARMIRKDDKIWGRYWGAYRDIKDLHFAACYYAPMEYCIREGIRYFDPGAGSPHKIRRGFRAALDRSYHKFYDPVLEALFKSNINEVNRYERETVEELNSELPFRKHGGEDT